MAHTDNHRRAAGNAWSALLRVHAQLVPRIDADLRKSTGLPLAWYDVLLELDGIPPLRMTDLGERVVLSRTRVSRLVTELETAGLVTREANPDDGRSAFVAITAAGSTRLREAAPRYHAGIEERFAGKLEPDELQALTRTLSKILGPTDIS
ncbi:MarR family winged helix-turn-helix transcriptional regulator [Nocardia iowensis]|uniref:MarR family winged helix-turn-helix transcriptional regulator n=1 Tax=Nocardia iowensis TaxID=204891 RepID=A0ABX8RGH1_NOCIO|nr:MarR family winged helix-turn-helix transcriptional regulator [Nocardia iowensis]QXN88054.1 MarR family winged helix-turn-helix transcriptional regulator [Nocardia iowensis]